ncbi:DUF397 domain-containing protein [Actinoplanes sp. GCM10030250]|uniref:DUF397 domain-containing protein n=1 Tax=Actinoplanes sp. GCM10030250 TaxID=3273376 RepID=UPI0036202326
MGAFGYSRDLDWKRSRYCADNACVEVADDGHDIVSVRDGKHPDGPVLSFPADNWKAFMSDVNAGHFDG